jgi:hypothetical protein
MPSWLEQELLPPDPEFADQAGDPLAAGFRQGQTLDTASPELSTAAAADLVSGDLHYPPAPDGGTDSGETDNDGSRRDGTRARWGTALPGAGPYRTYPELDDDELTGVLRARQRLEARQAWEQLAALAEMIRRRPAPGCQPAAPGGMPAVWEEGLCLETALALAVSKNVADAMLGLAWDLQVKLPATSRRLRDGLLDQYKASLIARACAALTPAEAMAAEAILFAAPDCETWTPGRLRDRIARVVLEVNPDAARKRREDAVKRDAAIFTGLEDTGNMMIAGRELPPAAVLAMDQYITGRARQLRKAGVPGSLRELRVLAFLERMGAADPLANTSTSTDTSTDTDTDTDTDTEGDAWGEDPWDETGRTSDGIGGLLGLTSPVASTVHLTVPAATLTGDADRPGELRGAGPVDPDAARDLAEAAAASSDTTLEATITDQDGRPLAHACGKPEARQPTRGAGSGNRHGPEPPSGPGSAQLAAFARIGEGPEPRYGTWLYTHGTSRMVFEFEHLTGECDHRHQAAGHDPGKHLSHLTATLNQTCTNPACRTPERCCDYEHSRPWEQGGRTCLCEAGPVCRRDHQVKQSPGWKLEEAGSIGWFRWTTPSGRSYLHGPTEYAA